jgi:hypothetical protein
MSMSKRAMPPLTEAELEEDARQEATQPIVPTPCLALWGLSPPWQPLYFDGHSYVEEPTRAQRYDVVPGMEPPPQCRFVTLKEVDELDEAAFGILRAFDQIESPYLAL